MPYMLLLANVVWIQYTDSQLPHCSYIQWIVVGYQRYQIYRKHLKMEYVPSKTFITLVESCTICKSGIVEMLITISITKLKKTVEYVPSTSLITLVTSCAINKRKLPIMINVSGFITETCHSKACFWWLYCSVFPSHTCVYHGKAITIILVQTNRHSSPKSIKWQCLICSPVLGLD